MKLRAQAQDEEIGVAREEERCAAPRAFDSARQKLEAVRGAIAQLDETVRIWNAT